MSFDIASISSPRLSQRRCIKKRSASDKALPDGKSLWIFTNDDDPLADDPGAEGQTNIEKAASDLADNGVDVHVWPVKTPFKSDFYDGILSQPIEPTQSEEDVFDVEELMDRIKREFKKIRTANKIPLLLPNSPPESPGIMIDVFRPLQIQKKPQAKIIHQETKR